MALDNILTINTNELFRDNPYSLWGGNFIGLHDFIAYNEYSTVGGNPPPEGGMYFFGTYGQTVAGMKNLTDMDIVAGDKIYVRLQYRVHSGYETETDRQIVMTLGGVDLSVPFTYSTDKGVLKTFTNVVEMVGVGGKVNFEFVCTYSPSFSNAGSCVIITIGMINLTKRYGAGREPTKSQCDTLFPDIASMTYYMEDMIKNNILADYANGIVTASQEELACLDVYDISGNKVLDFTKGEILRVGDIVRIDKDNIGNSLLKKPNGEPRYFQIVSRTFTKRGVPLLSLKYREVK